MGVLVGGHETTNFSHISKDAQENSISFDIFVVTEGDRGKMVLNEKLSKIGFYMTLTSKLDLETV